MSKGSLYPELHGFLPGLRKDVGVQLNKLRHARWPLGDVLAISGSLRCLAIHLDVMGSVNDVMSTMKVLADHEMHVSLLVAEHLSAEFQFQLHEIGRYAVIVSDFGLRGLG